MTRNDGTSERGADAVRYCAAAPPPRRWAHSPRTGRHKHPSTTAPHPPAPVRHGARAGGSRARAPRAAPPAGAAVCARLRGLFCWSPRAQPHLWRARVIRRVVWALGRARRGPATAVPRRGGRGGGGTRGSAAHRRLAAHGGPANDSGNDYTVFTRRRRPMEETLRRATAQAPAPRDARAAARVRGAVGWGGRRPL
jgi:hypothetical protein